MEIIAHRGASFDAPENSLESFDLAIAQGAQRLELDIQLTADGLPIVLHDETTTRTTGVALTVAETPWAALQHLRLPNGEAIPTFDALCASVRGRVQLDVELKATQPAVVDGILETLSTYDLREDALISSFDASVLRMVRDRGFTGRTGLVVGSTSKSPRQRMFEAWPFPTMDAVDATDLIIHHRLYHPLLKRQLARRGGRLLFWMSMEDETKDEAIRTAYYRRIQSISPDGAIIGRVAEALPFLRGC